MRRLIAALLTVLAWLLLAPVAEAQTAGFVAQRGNVTCLYADFEDTPASLRCDTRRDRNAPPKPESCELDWGGAFAMERRGRAARICHGDTVIGSATRRLAYGRTWERGGFRCRSTRARLRCVNRSGHGFLLRARRHTIF
jgi:hypothetical protein